MAVVSCKYSRDCPGSDFPITNYSAEDAEQSGLCFSLYFPQSVFDGGCVSVCSVASNTPTCDDATQNAADLCVLQQASQCPPGDNRHIFCNVATTCSCVSAGGAEFFYTTPAGTFCAETQEAADALAHAYACQHCHNPATSVQIGGLDACTCINHTYAEQILYTGQAPIVWAVTSGALPTGLSLNVHTGVVSGTTTVAGEFTFTITAYLASGDYGTRTMTISVLEITTTALDDYTLGTAYSFQLQASGGSGNYAWKVSSGTLPTGLTLSASGLLSGTPTAAGSDNIQFQVIDLNCEAANKTYFTPRITAVGTSQTILRTRRGYGEYVYSTGALYKKVTYNGYATQRAYAETQVFGSPGPLEYCGGAKYVYSGSSEINNQGVFISSHRKDLSVNCLAAPVLHLWDIFGAATWVNFLLGYCWPADPDTCSVCSDDETTWLFKINQATHSQSDLPHDIIAGNLATTSSPTSFSIVVPNGGTSAPMYLGSTPSQPNQYPNPQNFPFSTLNTITWHYVQLRSSIDFTATLSEEFTEADAIAGQVVFNSNGLTAENRPGILTWVADYITNIQSRYTSSNFSLRCSNLVDGESYDVTYEFWDSNGTVTAVLSSFIAFGTTHNVTGSVPTPAAGHTVTLRNARISFS